MSADKAAFRGGEWQLRAETTSCTCATSSLRVRIHAHVVAQAPGTRSIFKSRILGGSGHLGVPRRRPRVTTRTVQYQYHWLAPPALLAVQQLSHRIRVSYCDNCRVRGGHEAGPQRKTTTRQQTESCLDAGCPGRQVASSLPCRTRRLESARGCSSHSAHQSTGFFSTRNLWQGLPGSGYPPRPLRTSPRHRLRRRRPGWFLTGTPGAQTATLCSRTALALSLPSSFPRCQTFPFHSPALPLCLNQRLIPPPLAISRPAARRQMAW
ncbi:hypothetical protein XA68_14809 [Ophiocordyceps unilateralis]|uniref:Uncharacterized protein n=1 Tax=Ophiocordyceps unilateralis TaxID=268505 RepID=A0A2A9P9J2_OPHUN|nr:hypothetical protein XA68_14809 [Ophiocordyceps unilateralis]